MILKQANVTKYKSILDSTPVSIEKDITCLVGKNESGKTAFLESLYKLNPVPSGHNTEFNELYEYPRRHRSRDRKIIESVSPISAVFELEPEEIANIEQEFGKGILTSREIVVKKYYTNEVAWEFDLNERVAIDQLINELGVNKEITGDCSSIQELREKVATINDESPGVSSLKDRLLDYSLEEDLISSLEGILPKFIYFDQYSTLPGRFSLARLKLQPPEDPLHADERTALSFLRLAGADMDEFEEDDYEARKAALESAAITITDEIFEYWRQNSNLRVQIDIDNKRNRSRDKYDPPYVEIRIENLRHQVTINFGERSTGFVWFFSFLAFFSEYRENEEKYILLLDEPGLSLHATAQEDLLKYIDEKLAPGNQVVYTTHSPFMVKTTELQGVRTVEDIDQEGTKITEDVFSHGKDTIFPLQAALGYHLAQSLFVGPNNILVEGPSDMIYLQVLSEYLNSKGMKGLDEKVVLVPVGGIDKIPTFIALLGTQLNVSVLIDHTSGGNQKINSMIERGLLNSSNLVSISEFTQTKEADIEDMFEVDYYLELLKKSGGPSVEISDLQPGPRLIKRIESALKTKFDHYKPSSYLLRNQEILLEKLSEDTIQRFEKLFSRVNSTLV